MPGAVTPPLAGWIEAAGLPTGVRGGCAGRQFAGVSAAPFDRANYGQRSGDDPESVRRNRELLRAQLGLEAEPLWLQQVHGIEVLRIDAQATRPAQMPAPEADACVVRGNGIAAVIQSADCLPILLAARHQPLVAAIHAGWRGLAAGVIERTVSALQVEAGELHAWLGPAIGPGAFEVGPEVRAEFVAADAGASNCFQRGRDDRWHADLYGLARLRMKALGVGAISGGHWCTYDDSDSFHSYRRDGVRSGRMASLIWRQ